MDNDTRQTLRFVRIGTCASLALILIIAVALLVAVPRVMRTLDHMEQTLSSIDELAVSADTALDAANVMIEGNADAVTEAMQKFNSVDFENLNKAIKDLSDVVEPLARVSNFFSR